MSSGGPQNGGGDGGQQPPQQENAAVKWYREWSATTPFITRATLQLLVVLWALSWIVDPASVLVNVPALTILRLQLWRVLTSPLYSEGLLSVLFICLSMGGLATTLELSLGSTSFTLLMVTLAVGSNLLFLALAFLLSLAMGSGALFMMAGSFWLVVLGLITVDCLQNPEAARQIPAKYLPLLFYAIFALFGGPRLDMACSIALGYAYGYGYLKPLEPSARLLARLEESRPWSYLVAKPGFVTHGQAQGPQATWLPTAIPPSGAGNGSGGVGGGSRFGGFGGSGGQALGGGGRAPPATNPPTVHTMGGGGGGKAAGGTVAAPQPTFQGSGHTLGGSSTSTRSSSTGGGGGGGVRGLFGGGGGSSSSNSSGAGAVLTDPRAVAEARAAKFSAPNGPMAPSSNDDEKETATLLRR